MSPPSASAAATSAAGGSFGPAGNAEAMALVPAAGDADGGPDATGPELPPQAEARVATIATAAAIRRWDS